MRIRKLKNERSQLWNKIPSRLTSVNCHQREFRLFSVTVIITTVYIDNAIKKNCTALTAWKNIARIKKIMLERQNVSPSNYFRTRRISARFRFLFLPHVYSVRVRRHYQTAADKNRSIIICYSRYRKGIVAKGKIRRSVSLEKIPDKWKKEGKTLDFQIFEI